MHMQLYVTVLIGQFACGALVIIYVGNFCITASAKLPATAALHLADHSSIECNVDIVR